MAGRSVKGLVALVTGGASGLGLATTERLIKHGASAVLCDLPNSKGSSIAQRIGEKCIFSPCDVTSESDVKNALDVVKEKFGRLDVVVNCAGTNLMMRTHDFVAGTPHSLDSFKSMLKVKTMGTFNVTWLAAQMMAKNSLNDIGERGVIVNTTDICAYEGRQGHVAYSASSAAIESMTLPLARDLLSENIRCCAVATGLFDIPYYRSLPEKYRRYLPTIVTYPKGLGSPDEYAYLVQTIIENQQINGEVVRIDGALRYTI